MDMPRPELPSPPTPKIPSFIEEYPRTALSKLALSPTPAGVSLEWLEDAERTLLHHGLHKAILHTHELSVEINGKFLRGQHSDSSPTKVQWVSDRSLGHTNPVFPAHDVELLPNEARLVPLLLDHGSSIPRYFRGNLETEFQEGYTSVSDLLADDRYPRVLLCNVGLHPIIISSSVSVGTVTSLHARKVYVVATTHRANRASVRATMAHTQMAQPNPVHPRSSNDPPEPQPLSAEFPFSRPLRDPVESVRKSPPEVSFPRAGSSPVDRPNPPSRSPLPNQLVRTGPTSGESLYFRIMKDYFPNNDLAADLPILRNALRLLLDEFAAFLHTYRRDSASVTAEDQTLTLDAPPLPWQKLFCWTFLEWFIAETTGIPCHGPTMAALHNDPEDFLEHDPPKHLSWQEYADQRLPTRWLQRFSGPKGPVWSTYAQQLLDTLHAAHN